MGGAGPVNEPDLVHAAYLYLAGISEVVAAVGSIVPADPDEDEVPYIFQRKTGVQMQQSGSSFIIVNKDGIWTSPNQHNTAEFPRLKIVLFVDPRRTTEYNPLDNQVIDNAEAYRRINALYRIVDRYLHRPQHDTTTWGGLRIHSCVRLAASEPVEVPQQDGLLAMDIYYAIEAD